MKKICTLMGLLSLTLWVKAQSVAINTDGSNADSSAILDVKSTSQGMLVPRVTAAQRIAIIKPAAGLLVYQTNLKKGFYYYGGAAWVPITDNNNNLWKGNDTTIYTTTSKVGIGLTNPRMPLHISTTSGLGMLIENPVNLATDLKTGLYFKSADQYYGAVKAIGTGATSGRLGLFTYSGADSNLLQERLSITDGGSVGINTTNPVYNLDVNGSTRTLNLTVSGNASVGGSASTTSNINVGGNAIVTGNITSGNLGMVSSANATQMKVAIYTATLTISNLGPNSLAGVSGNIGIAAGTFSAPPTAYIGDVIVGSENGDWYKVKLIPDQVTTTNIRIRIANPTATTISFSNVTWKVLVVGPR